jgi:serine/threonine-protein kinase
MTATSPIDSAPVSLAKPLPPVDGRYELLRPIAQGGMGRVYEARHAWSGRRVVVKILREDLAERTDCSERLRREAQAMARIDHPSVVSLLDGGRCPVHGAFVVTEHLEGRSLEGLLASRGALSVRNVLRVLREVGMALAEAHRQGVIHRDVKTANVFVARARGAEGDVVKLIDFGIARVGAAESTPALTMAGGILGTLATMAPEQLVAPSTVDGRADLYSLGIVALEALGAGAGDLAARMSTRNLASRVLGRRGDVPQELLALLDELCDPDAARRPASAEVMLSRLATIRVSGFEGEALLGYEPEPDAGPEARRRHARAPYLTPVRIQHMGGILDGRSEDVSLGGMLVVTSGPAPSGNVAIIRFALPTTGRVVGVRAHVRWTRQQPGRTAMGLEFIDLDERAREAIASYVSWLGVAA